jgi:hypothetical protein
VCIALSCCAFLLVRPYALAERDLVYSGDDDDYMAHATAIAFGRFPDYTRENNATFPPYRPTGSGILAAPFVAAFSLLDRIAGNPVVTVRTADSLRGSWTAYGFVVATQCYLLLALYLLFRTCRELLGSVSAGSSLLLVVLGSGLPLYAYRRPVFSHVYELFAVTVPLYLLVCALTRPSARGWRWALGAFGSAVLICLVRPNDAV